MISLPVGLADLVGQFIHREFARDCRYLPASESSSRFGVHQPDQAVDQIADVTERTRLAAVAVDRQLFAAQRLNDKIRNDAAVVFQHPLAVSVENADDSRVDVVLAMIVHHQRFGDAFAFVVTAAEADRS